MNADRDIVYNLVAATSQVEMRPVWIEAVVFMNRNALFSANAFYYGGIMGLLPIRLALSVPKGGCCVVIFEHPPYIYKGFNLAITGLGVTTVGYRLQ